MTSVGSMPGMVSAAAATSSATAEGWTGSSKNVPSAATMSSWSSGFSSLGSEQLVGGLLAGSQGYNVGHMPDKSTVAAAAHHAAASHHPAAHPYPAYFSQFTDPSLMCGRVH